VRGNYALTVLLRHSVISRTDWSSGLEYRKKQIIVGTNVCLTTSTADQAASASSLWCPPAA